MRILAPLTQRVMANNVSVSENVEISVGGVDYFLVPSSEVGLFFTVLTSVYSFMRTRFRTSFNRVSTSMALLLRSWWYL